MASKGGLISTLVLRVFALALLAASIVILATNKFTSDGSKITFKNVQAYRYVIAAACLGFLYTLFQIPFAIYHVCTEKRLIRHGCLPEFDFYADKIIAFILATAVGAGFAVTFEFKKILNEFKEAFAGLIGPDGDAEISDSEKFLDKGNIAIGILLLGFLCVAAQCVISSMSRTGNSGRGFFG